ncbi:hypothetical protein P43SY_009394 [Pythium insidiosum]|uniref:FYVE-type domain-containing protein n=1 Tax=Pythium insidiosum TaxID=114742 RepID=A0AAD5LFY0_PYTIN|nr:hypothetical protein P43SY_009394 [Pythium insidiosum]
MHLKFPLPAGYFPPFELSNEETVAFKDLVTEIVKETRHEYERYVREGQRQVEARTWKHTKSKERIHIYRRRSEYGAAPVGLYGSGSQSGNGPYSNSHGSVGSFDMGLRSSSESSMTGGMPVRGLRSRISSSSTSSGHAGGDGLASVDERSTTVMPPRRQLEPSMLAVGVMEGTVDDIIFALHEGTAEEMKAMAAFIGDDSLFDAVVLHTIKQNRTTYLGLKWKLSRTPGGNRDMCFIEYVGVANDSKGQRFGFRVIESIKLRHCPPFDDNSIIRTDLSFCYLFRETGTAGLVDVFMQGAFDSSADVVTAGGVGDARSTMEMLLSVESCMERAEAKKLGELVAKQAQQPPRPQSGSQCSICRAKPGLLSSHLLCQGCGVVICTKCRMKKVIISKRGSKQKVSCCKICLVNVKDKSPFDGETIPTQQPMQKKSSMSSMSSPPSRSVGSAAGVPLPVSRSTSNESASSAIGSHHAHHMTPELALSVKSKLERQRTGGDSLSDTEYSASMQSMQSWQSSSVSSSYSDLDDSYGSYSPNTVDGHQLVVADRQKMPAVLETPHSGQMMPARGGAMPPSAPGAVARPGAPGAPGAPMDQHRMGLYNQMLELQLQAERAYNIANQNAAFMQHQR